MTDHLTVYMAGETVGTLKSNGRQGLTFCYAQEWLDLGGLQLSAHLPCRPDEYGPDQATPFFENLLPESGIRRSLARYFRVPESDTYQMLRHLGGDCAGAISILPGDQTLVESATYSALSVDQLENLLFAPGTRPFAAGQEGIRLSLAGAQAKLPVFFDGELFALPTGTAPSTHIIKPAIPDIPHTVQNEAFCMRLAANIGLSVPDVQIYRGLSQPVYLIQRYDRIYRSDGTYLRIPQEDFCQALGVMPDNKYEADGGPSLHDCFTLIETQFSDPASDTLALLDWALFNLLIGNADAHAKNISILRLPTRTRLAPFYDLLCTSIYPNLNSKLAMKIGGQDRPNYIFPVHWKRFYDEIGVKQALVAKRAYQLIDSVLGAFGIVAGQLELTKDELGIIQHIGQIVDKRSGKLSTLLEKKL